jgi:hypothetical protein
MEMKISAVLSLLWRRFALSSSGRRFFPLVKANEALATVKNDSIDGAAVIVAQGSPAENLAGIQLR